MKGNNLPSKEAIVDNIITRQIANAFSILDSQTQGDEDINYKLLYYGLFNGITQIVRSTTTYQQTVDALNYLQCLAEDAYIRHNRNE